ncbi:multidrug effflux MFS transporter [Arthrobacter cavernae]|uniref:Multidrug effflux MFS transporter n=1 Tax=Arthrobacter cavernae TaxID=2817681 RepID=A0A939KPN9_9MICC|nr:multidrug effflux MFS transporter [Arthrobacter cavernae]MBO1268995.1 multidrug effflux MFS transporter [Arthrobacter cavernae]
MSSATIPTNTAKSTGKKNVVSAALVASVIFITAIAPLATDMYVPAFPMVSADLGASATEVQLTLTTFFVGMGLGQLVGGPFSDQRGRRWPLLASTVVVFIASVLCAMAPTAGAMMAARFVQGFAGGWAMVIGRAIIIDLVSGSQLVRVLNIIAGVGGISPVISPLLGAGILQVSHWRTAFWVLAAAGLLMALCTVFIVPESLPKERRHGGGLRTFARAAREVLGKREYLGYMIVSSAAMIALFAYVATSAFVLQSMNGLSPVAYSVVFAANAAAAAVAALVSARLAGRVSTRKVIAVGLVIDLVAGVVMLASALWLGTPLLAALGCFLAVMVAQGLLGGNGGALAAAAVPDHPGTGSAVLGMTQWVIAGIAAPIAGLGGSHTAVPMATMIVVGTLIAFVGLAIARRPIK